MCLEKCVYSKSDRVSNMQENNNMSKNSGMPENPESSGNSENKENSEDKSTPQNKNTSQGMPTSKNKDIEEDYSLSECSEDCLDLSDTKEDYALDQYSEECLDPSKASSHNQKCARTLKSVNKSILAARYGYIVLGSAMAAWASLVPYTKDRLDITESTLGFLLLCLGLGALVSMPAASVLTARYGCKKVQNICIPIYYISLVLLIIAPNPLTIALVLLVFGGMSGLLDVVMNLQVVFLEQTSGRRMMASLHAMYMVGVAIGSGGMALLFSIGFSPLSAAFCMAVLFITLQFIFFGKHFYPFGGNKTNATFMVLPRGSVLILGVICYVLYMIEGVIMDWSALFMNLERNVPVTEAGLAYGLFAITMTVGRLCGDRLGEMLGAKKLLIAGCAVTALGFFMLSSIQSIVGSYFSFFLIGIGAANTIPLLFTITSKQKSMDMSAGIAAVSTIGYMGLLSGPAFMGFVGEYFGLPRIFFMMAIFVAMMAIVSMYIKEDK